MKIAAKYSHLNGFEWLIYHHPRIWKQVTAAIEGINARQYKTKVSDEKTKLGRRLYSPAALNKAFEKRIGKYKWRSARKEFYVTDDPDLTREIYKLELGEQKSALLANGKSPILSHTETDFLQHRVAIEIQFGKYSFISYDIFVKHMAFFIADKIDLGIEIVPMKSMQEQMSSGPGYYEAAIHQIIQQGRGVPAVPLIIVGIAP